MSPPQGAGPARRRVTSASWWALPVIGLALGLALPLSARPVAFIRSSLFCQECDSAVTNLERILVANGYSIRRGYTEVTDTDLSGATCAFELGPTAPLTPAEIASYLAFLQQGAGLYLGGENLNFDPRNQSLAEALTAFGAGVVFIWDSRPAVAPSPILLPETVNTRTLPVHPIMLTPAACGPVETVVYDGVGIGWIQLPGGGDVLTGFPGASPSAAWGLDRDGLEDLDNAPDGRVVTVLDLNWLSTTFELGDNGRFATGIVDWLCGGPEQAAAGPAAHQPTCAPRSPCFWRSQCDASEAPSEPQVMAAETDGARGARRIARSARAPVAPASALAPRSAHSAASPCSTPSSAVPLIVADWATLRISVDALLNQFGLPTNRTPGRSQTCEALDPSPPDDPCELALAAATVWALSVRDGLVSCDCPYDADAIDLILTSDGGAGLPVNLDASEFAGYLLLLVTEGRCDVARQVAEGLSDGRLLLAYQGPGDVGG